MDIEQTNNLLSAFAMCLFDTEHTWEEIEELIRDFNLPEDVIEHCLVLIQLYKSK